MPAPKAVLRDIADFNLDPTKPFGRTSSSGRLAHDGNGLTSTTTQGKPPVTTGSHFHFYGRLEHPSAHPAKQEVAESKPHVDPVPPAPVRAEEEVTKPSAEAAPPVEVPAEAVEEKGAPVDSAVETEQATPAAKKGPRGKKPGTESQA